MSYNEKDYNEDLTKARDERCVPVAKEIIKKVSLVDGAAGNESPEKMQEAYDAVAKEILQSFLDNKLLISDVSYVYQLVLQIINAAFDIVNKSVNINLKTLEVKLLGKEVRDITFEELDENLKK